VSLHVASNGSIALAVWNDDRRGPTDVTACRIAADGTPLDPTGIVIQPGSIVNDVFWTGSAFAVVTSPAFITVNGTSVISYVGSDGTVTQGSPLASDLMIYGARSGEGADTRFLFLPADGYSALAQVVDAPGNVIKPGNGDHGGAITAVFAASNGSGFLVLREFDSNGAIGKPPVYIAETLDRDGNVLTSADPQLPAPFKAAALTGDAHGGYVLFGYRPNQNDFVVVHLGANGIATAPPQFLQTFAPLAVAPGPVSARTTQSGFAASWMVQLPDNHTSTYVSRDGGVPVMTFDWIGYEGDTAYDPLNDLVLTSYNDAFTTMGADVFVQKGSGAPVPLTSSAHQQTNAAIAAGANGFLAAWAENTGTGVTLYVRRFSPDATAQDAPQVADTKPNPNDRFLEFQRSSITSAGNGYLVTWDRTFARRMDARTGQWLDATPFRLLSMAAASNGSDVLALTVENCEFGCTMARRVSMTGDPVVSDGVKLSDYRVASQPAIASDGNNYLAVWNDGAYDCFPDCVLPAATRVVAMRLRPDGSHIDAAPIVLEPSSPYQAYPSVAWNGSTYLVSWTTDSGYSIAAAYVAPDGTIQQLGTIARLNTLITSLKAVAHAGEFLILSSHPIPSPVPVPDQLSLTLLDGSTIAIETRPTGEFAPPDAASDGLHLMLAYDRVDLQAGRVGRVVLDPRVFPSRKRRAAR